MHKPRRSIVSSTNITVWVSTHKDFIFKPYAASAPSYIRDATDFLRKLQYTHNFPDKTILTTMDAEIIYTNISEIDYRVLRIPFKIQMKPTFVTTLRNFRLTHNYFTFANKTYLQINGASMRSHMAPQYVNIFTAIVTKKLRYLRYTDDFVVVVVSPTEIPSGSISYPNINFNLHKKDAFSRYPCDTIMWVLALCCIENPLFGMHISMLPASVINATQTLSPQVQSHLFRAKILPIQYG